MPVEIKELVIRTQISEAAGAASGSGQSSDTSMDQAALISACVEQVLSILKDRAER